MALTLGSESRTPNALPSQLRPASPSGSAGSTVEELDMEAKAWQELDNSRFTTETGERAPLQRPQGHWVHRPLPIAKDMQHHHGDKL